MTLIKENPMQTDNKASAPVARGRRWIAAAIFAAAMPVAHPASAQQDCSDVVEMARDNIFLRINGGDNAANSRESSKARLDRAGFAAAQGREDDCWDQLEWSSYLIRMNDPATRANEARKLPTTP